MVFIVNTLDAGPNNQLLTYDNSETTGNRLLHIFEGGSRVGTPSHIHYTNSAAALGLPLGLSIPNDIDQAYLRWDDPGKDGERVVTRISFVTMPSHQAQQMYTLFRAMAGSTSLWTCSIFGRTNDITFRTGVRVQSNPASEYIVDYDTLYHAEIAYTPGVSIASRLLSAQETVLHEYTISADVPELDVDTHRYGASWPNNAGGPMRMGPIQVKSLATGWLGPIGSNTPLDAPVLTLVNDSPASSVGANDREITVSWPAVPNANGYRALSAPFGSSDYSLVEESVTSPYTFLNRPAAGHRIGIQAKE